MYAVVRKDDGWWITDTGSEVGDFGPYSTKTEALETVRRLKDFDRYEARETD